MLTPYILKVDKLQPYTHPDNIMGCALIKTAAFYGNNHATLTSILSHIPKCEEICNDPRKACIHIVDILMTHIEARNDYFDVNYVPISKNNHNEYTLVHGMVVTCYLNYILVKLLDTVLNLQLLV